MGAGTLLLPSLCAAEWNWLTFEGEQKPWSVNVGTRVWLNEWETNTRNANLTTTLVRTDNQGNAIASQLSLSNNHNQQLTSEAHEATAIPYLSARYGRFFVGGNYYSETSFQFSPQRDTVNYTDLTCVNNNCLLNRGIADVFRNATGERTEWDVSAGYYVLPGLAFTVGYKSIDMDLSTATDFSITNYNGVFGTNSASGHTTFTAQNRFTGPTIGLAASVPIAYGVGLYGSYAHGFISWDYKEQQDGNQTFKASDGGDYDVAEIGLTYTPDLKSLYAHLPMDSASVFAGYRFQRLQYGVAVKSAANDTDNGYSIENASDTTQGFAAGINLGF